MSSESVDSDSQVLERDHQQADIALIVGVALGGVAFIFIVVSVYRTYRARRRKQQSLAATHDLERKEMSQRGEAKGLPTFSEKDKRNRSAPLPLLPFSTFSANYHGAAPYATLPGTPSPVPPLPTYPEIQTPRLVHIHHQPAASWTSKSHS